MILLSRRRLAFIIVSPFAAACRCAYVDIADYHSASRRLMISLSYAVTAISRLPSSLFRAAAMFDGFIFRLLSPMPPILAIRL